MGVKLHIFFWKISNWPLKHQTKREKKLNGKKREEKFGYLPKIYAQKNFFFSLIEKKLLKFLANRQKIYQIRSQSFLETKKDFFFNKVFFF